MTKIVTRYGSEGSVKLFNPLSDLKSKMQVAERAGRYEVVEMVQWQFLELLSALRRAAKRN